MRNQEPEPGRDVFTDEVLHEIHGQLLRLDRKGRIQVVSTLLMIYPEVESTARRDKGRQNLAGLNLSPAAPPEITCFSDLVDTIRPSSARVLAFSAAIWLGHYSDRPVFSTREIRDLVASIDGPDTIEYSARLIDLETRYGWIERARESRPPLAAGDRRGSRRVYYRLSESGVAEAERLLESP